MSREVEERLRSMFRAEAVETLDALRTLFGRMRASHGQLAADEVRDAMRLAHNFKGGAASVGFEAAAVLAHALEDAILDGSRRGPAELLENAGLFLEVVSALHRSIEGAADDLLREVEARLRERFGAKSEPSRAEPVRGLSSGSRDEHAGRPAEVPAPAVLADVLVSTDDTVRIDTKKLDRLYALVAELLAAHNEMRVRHRELRELTFALEENIDDPRADLRIQARQLARRAGVFVKGHEATVRGFGRLVADFHEAIRSTRMVPLSVLSAQLRRASDDAALMLGKQVAIEFDVSGIELDKVVLDALREPLIHLVRNAVDHGIESAEAREMLGKPEVGVVRVAAKMTGPNVYIEVMDDGAGLSVRTLRKLVVERGLVTDAAEEAKLTDREVLEFLFYEGFSTRSEATLVSGRGVGLDVVRREVKALDGTVVPVVRSALGGAAFAVTVPLSILSTRVLLVRASGATYAIPIHSVDSVARMPRAAIETVGDQPFLRVGSREPLRLRWLARALGRSVTDVRGDLTLLLLHGSGEQQWVAVDEILHEDDCVIRKLPWNLATVPGITGAVGLADGSVALVPDVGSIVSGPLLRTQDPTHTARRARVLVVDDSITTRTLHRNVLVEAGYEVLLAHDGAEALRRLEEEPVDVVVTDVQMPELDGFALTRRIRASEQLASIPVILVTSLARPEDARMGLDAGADEYVVKGPLEQDELLAAVSRHVG